MTPPGRFTAQIPQPLAPVTLLHFPNCPLEEWALTEWGEIGCLSRMDAALLRAILLEVPAALLLKMIVMHHCESLRTHFYSRAAYSSFPEAALGLLPRWCSRPLWMFRLAKARSKFSRRPMCSVATRRLTEPHGQH